MSSHNLYFCNLSYFLRLHLTKLIFFFRNFWISCQSKGFFRGLSWPLLSSSYLNAIFFGTYGLVLKKLDYLDDLTHKPSYWTLGFAAAVATAPQLLFSVPVEVIKVTLQSQIPHVHDGGCIIRTILWTVWWAIFPVLMLHLHDLKDLTFSEAVVEENEILINFGAFFFFKDK